MENGKPHIWLEEGGVETSFFLPIRSMLQKGGEKCKEKGGNREKMKEKKKEK